MGDSIIIDCRPSHWTVLFGRSLPDDFRSALFAKSPHIRFISSQCKYVLRLQSGKA